MGGSQSFLTKIPYGYALCGVRESQERVCVCVCVCDGRGRCSDVRCVFAQAHATCTSYIFVRILLDNSTIDPTY
jgi:hypothetical protein